MRLGYRRNRSPLSRAHRRFNEAEAHAPRIPAESLRADLPDIMASMRPRRMRLGYLPCAPGCRFASDSFNEAEAHAPRILARPLAQGRGKCRLQ